MNSKKKKSSKTLLYTGLCLILMVFLDQMTKLLAILHLKDQEPISIIDGVFELKYLENQSAAFSMDPISIIHRLFSISYFDKHPTVFLRCKMFFFITLTILVLIFLYRLYVRIPWERRYLPLNLIIVGFSAGAIGNVIDRIIHNYVVDFLYFRLINFPVFNVADIYVTVAAISVVIVVLFVYHEEDFEQLFPSKKKQENQEQ